MTAPAAQLDLFPVSVTARVTVRRRRVFRYIDLRGELRTKIVVESLPCAIPTTADDRGLPPEGRWTPPRHARSFDVLPYEDDMAVRAFVRDHPEGATLQEIADEIGWTRQGVLEVERRALAKLVKLATRDADAREWMAAHMGVELEEIERLIGRRS